MVVMGYFVDVTRGWLALPMEYSCHMARFEFRLVSYCEECECVLCAVFLVGNIEFDSFLNPNTLLES